ncbi:DUF3025 domain-containing protein [Chitinibacter sp. ZOR0017]|uniref:DUF3025 domain-containing protein n=1 Tax=Chitinibacter sp. ZOR0017 TaxID=1339254 RepID=UPI0006487E73|nr:DUF3025 domain-containing protein [Chitinibacter sp. ZOR0017]
MSSWPQALFEQHPAFRLLHPLLGQFRAIPTHADWDQLPSPARSPSGAPIRFVDPDSITAYYELAIYQHGTVATRLNWHDTFNALIWHRFPRLKIALNQLHQRQISQASAPNIRGPVRDAATLFDECGFILPYSQPALLELLQQHRWEALFLTERAAWGQTIAAYSFGHANFENLLAPFVGLTGKCWPIAVAAEFFSWPLDLQLNWLDGELAAAVDADQLQTPRQLPPLPYLGIPGWYPQQDTAFYQNTAYFRPKRQTIPSKV